MSFNINAVYYVQSQNKRDINCIAVRPTFYRNDIVEWDDMTPRGKVIRFTNLIFNEISEEDVIKGTVPHKIIIKTADDKIMLTYITKDLFENTVVKNVAHDPNERFSNDEEVQKSFLNPYA